MPFSERPNFNFIARPGCLLEYSSLRNKHRVHRKNKEALLSDLDSVNLFVNLFKQVSLLLETASDVQQPEFDQIQVAAHLMMSLITEVPV